MMAYKSGWGEIFERGVRLPPYITHQEEVLPIPAKGFLNLGG